MSEKRSNLNKVGQLLQTIVWTDKFGLECYGTKLNIKSDNEFLRDGVREYLPNVKLENFFDNVSDTVFFITNRGKITNGMYFNEEPAMNIEKISDNLFEVAADKILTIMATISLPSKIYMHAGAVVWKGLGILIPGMSCAGKTTLVKEFIKAGAVYYSDDCIILDDECNMLPFPRDLSIRTENGKIFREASHFGAETGVDKVGVNLILFSQYQENIVWKPHQISPGKSVLKLMDNFYYRSSVGNAPSEIIKTMANLTARAASFGGERGEASQVINWVSREFLSK